MKKPLTEEYFINWWLEKYHHTNLTKVMEEHPEWADDPPSHSMEFYAAYPCTQEEHDVWYEWAIDVIAKHYRISKKSAKQRFSLPYLNVSPTVQPKKP